MFERSHVDTGADQPLDDFELVDMRRHEIGLNSVPVEPLQVLQVEGRGCIDHHARPGGLHLGIGEVRPVDILRGPSSR